MCLELFFFSSCFGLKIFFFILGYYRGQNDDDDDNNNNNNNKKKSKTKTVVVALTTSPALLLFYACVVCVLYSYDIIPVCLYHMLHLLKAKTNFFRPKNIRLAIFLHSRVVTFSARFEIQTPLSKNDDDESRVVDELKKKTRR